MNVAAGLSRVGDLAAEVRSVDPILQRRAELVAALVCRRLGIPTVRVRWLPAEPGGHRGCTYPDRPDEVWVRAGQSVAATVETVSHECRHAWQLQPDQFRWLTPGLKTMDDRERDAADYGRRIRAELTRG